MRLISPVFPGTVFAVGAILEVGLLAATSQDRDPALPVWAQLIPLGIVLGIGAWGLVRLFAHERDTAIRLAALEEKLSSRQEAQHRENLTRFTHLDSKLDPLLVMMMGVQGRGGYLDEISRNRERRHALSQHIQMLHSDLYHLCEWAEAVGAKLEVPYRCPPPPQHRRSGDAPDG